MSLTTSDSIDFDNSLKSNLVFRIKNIINLVDHIAVVFPFEETLFQKYTKSVTYVGHPLSDNANMNPSTLDYKDKPIELGIFPGSRESEIKNNLFSMIDLIKQKNLPYLSTFTPQSKLDAYYTVTAQSNWQFILDKKFICTKMKKKK